LKLNIFLECISKDGRKESLNPRVEGISGALNFGAGITLNKFFTE